MSLQYFSLKDIEPLFSELLKHAQSFRSFVEKLRKSVDFRLLKMEKFLTLQGGYHDNKRYHRFESFISYPS
ncbi:MAG: hypothetical protein K940chlam2_00157 [Chlamydiae bacterium]|nr:hypothetical protein [Chlamydiota bacterium]